MSLPLESGYLTRFFFLSGLIEKFIWERKKSFIAKFSYSDNESNSDSAQFVDVQKGSENNATISYNENNAAIV